jgi:hypothetical protein
MMDALTAVLARFRGRDVLLDANILLMDVIGTLDPARISTFKRTKMFTIDNYALLVRLLRQWFRAVVTTPNILTEVSNLAGELGEPLKARVFQIFAEAVKRVPEHYAASRAATEHPAFVKFGLTDAVMARMAAGDILVLTVDFPLSQYLECSQLPVLNFNHLRILV